MIMQPMPLRLARLLALIAVVALVTSVDSARADAALSAKQVADRIVKSNGFNWEGAETKIRMVIVEPSGKRSERRLRVIGRRTKGQLETVVRFLAPQDVAGTAFLMREKAGKKPEQHIYLPGLRRTRRIVGREREGSFMGSDFSYADLQRTDVRDAKHRKLPDEKIGSDAVYVIESKLGPRSKSNYAKVVTWVRKSDFVPLRTKFFGKRGGVVKTLYARRVKKLDGRPVIVEARMQSANGHATVLIVDSIERREDLPDSAFTPTALER